MTPFDENEALDQGAFRESVRFIEEKLRGEIPWCILCLIQ